MPFEEQAGKDRHVDLCHYCSKKQKHSRHQQRHFRCPRHTNQHRDDTLELQLNGATQDVVEAPNNEVDTIPSPAPETICSPTLMQRRQRSANVESVQNSLHESSLPPYKSKPPSQCTDPTDGHTNICDDSVWSPVADVSQAQQYRINPGRQAQVEVGKSQGKCSPRVRFTPCRDPISLDPNKSMVIDQFRDQRFSAMVNDCINDSRFTNSSSAYRSSLNGQTQTQQSNGSGILDSLLGLNVINPQDLVQCEGAKVDGGFGGVVLPCRQRESSALLNDALSRRLSMGSATTNSSVTTTLSSYLRHLKSKQKKGKTNESIKENKCSTICSPEGQASILSGGIDRDFHRSYLNIRHDDTSIHGKSPQNFREERWDTIHLDTACKSPNGAAAIEDQYHKQGSINSKFQECAVSDEKHKDPNFCHRYPDLTNAVQKMESSTPRDSITPPGMSQEDIVAICLVQGMVPPGIPPDDTLVTWSGPLSPGNPRNWSTYHKWYACVLISLATFLANAGTNVIAPALGLISKSYKEIYIPIVRGLLIGSYVFALTFGPLIYGPMSELLGRKPVLLLGSGLFCGKCDTRNSIQILFGAVASFLSGFVDATWELMILRFITALGASAPMTIGGAVLTDIFAPEHRGPAMTVFFLAPQLGPVVGPIMGGWVTQEGRNWRWIFWICAIAAGIVGLLMTFMRETYTPRILARRARELRRKTGNERLATIFERRRETVKQILTRGAVRPLVLFSCEPIVQLLCCYVSVLYGIMHLLTATFPAVFGM